MQRVRAMRWLVVAFACAGCSDYRSHTHAFVAETSCGQGPYDVRLHSDGRSGGDGLAVIACTPRRLAGHVSYDIGSLHGDDTFGDVADNQRCVAGATTTIVATAPASHAPSNAGGTGAPTASSGTALVERPWQRKPGHWGDQTDAELCDPGSSPQTILRSHMLDHAPGEFDAGGELRVRIWSDAPNDLSGVVFMVIHETSKKSKQDVAKEQAKREREDAKHPRAGAPPPPIASAPPPPPDHGPPPPPLAEERPAQPRGATWTPGYWTWTGAAWGWIAGSWRDARIATPAPRIEMPGAPPAATAVWIAGSWQRRGGAWIWIGGRWR